MTSLLSHEIPADAAWSLLLRRGRHLTLTALGGGANCATLLFAAHDPVDRLNIPDTLKAQMRACIAPPMVLMSDRGAALASVVSSTLDWHDCLTGFGATPDWRTSARAGLVSELTKHGRDERDLHGPVNFFAKVQPGNDPSASLAYVPDHAGTGDAVTLRAEQDLLVVVATAAHPLDPAHRSAPVRAEVTEGAVYGLDDPSVRFRPESARALVAAQAVFA